MKTHWANLTFREKQIVGFGGGFLAIVLIYFFIWMPLAHQVVELRLQIQKNQQLLTWMQSADQQIHFHEKHPSSAIKKGSGSLLSQVQAHLKVSPIANALTQLRQADHDSVQLGFNQVNFDLLIDWIIQIGEQQGWVVSRIHIKPSGTSGMVAADFILE